MKGAEVWVVEYLADGVWDVFQPFVYLSEANSYLRERRSVTGDSSKWRRKRYVRDTSTPCGKGRNR